MCGVGVFCLCVFSPFLFLVFHTNMLVEWSSLLSQEKEGMQSGAEAEGKERHGGKGKVAGISQLAVVSCLSSSVTCGNE